ncbi:MAG: hypothetical protein IJI25_05685 [Eubacterium sp.]|nr:hypothetical protein [Eubacterium sp.]
MKKVIWGIALSLVFVLSLFVIAPKASKPEIYNGTIQMLNEKQANVLEMTSAASAASLALAAVPGDATTPIAEKVMDMAGYFIIILTVIILEKYLLTIAGYMTFTWLLPIACLLFLTYIVSGYKILRNLAVKVLVVGLSIVLIIPVSVRLTNLIEKTNEVSINNTMESVKEIQKEAEEAAKEEELEPEQEKMEKESSNPLDVIREMRSGISELKKKTTEALEEASSKVTRLSEEAIEKARETVNDFVEVVVVMLVTSCGIPMLTLMFFIWIIKTILGIDLDKIGEKVDTSSFLRV